MLVWTIFILQSIVIFSSDAVCVVGGGDFYQDVTDSLNNNEQKMALTWSLSSGSNPTECFSIQACITPADAPCVDLTGTSSSGKAHFNNLPSGKGYNGELSAVDSGGGETSQQTTAATFPYKPAGVSASNVGPFRLNLNIQEPSSPTIFSHYVVKYNNPDWTVEQANVTGPVTVYEVNGLSFGTQYTFYVYTLSNGLESKQQSSVTVTTGTSSTTTLAPTPAPTTTTTTMLPPPTTTTTTIPEPSTTTTTPTTTTPPPTTTTTTPPTTTTVGTTTPPTAPDPPVNPAATGGVNVIYVTWTLPATPVDDFQVICYQDLTVSDAVIVSNTSTSATCTRLQSATAHSVDACSLKYVPGGDTISSCNTPPIKVGTYPESPANPAAIASSNTIAVTWDLPTGNVDHFNVVCYLNNLTVDALIVPYPETTATCTGLDPATTYTVDVCSVADVDGESLTNCHEPILEVITDPALLAKHHVRRRKKN